MLPTAPTRRSLLSPSWPLISCGTLLLIGLFLHLDPIFYLGLVAAAATAVYQFYLCKDRDRQRCFKAFLNNIWFGGFVFVGLWLAYL